jgi:hypothetical protein
MMNFQGSGFNTEDFKDNKANVIVEVFLTTWERWVQSAKSEHQCVLFAIWLDNLVCTYMLWETMSFSFESLVKNIALWSFWELQAIRSCEQFHFCNTTWAIQCTLCTCYMFWETKSFALHHWWRTLLERTSENKWQKSWAFSFLWTFMCLAPMLAYCL